MRRNVLRKNCSPGGRAPRRSTLTSYWCPMAAPTRRAQRPECQAQGAADEFSRPLHMVYGSKLEHRAPSRARNPACQPCSASTAARCATSTPSTTDSLLIVATDRLSAFDVILPDPIPGKGRILNSISNFWFARTGHIMPQPPAGSTAGRGAARCRPNARRWRAAAWWRAACKALPIEAVVRGYLIGSGWKDYQATGQVCGIALPAGPAPGAEAAAAHLHAGHQGRGGRSRREHQLRRRRRSCVGGELAARVRDTAHRAVPLRRRACRAARHHHRRHQVRVRPGARTAS